MILAIAFSFPRAALTWGVILLSAQSTFTVLRDVSISAGVTAFLLFFLLAEITTGTAHILYRPMGQAILRLVPLLHTVFN